MSESEIIDSPEKFEKKWGLAVRLARGEPAGLIYLRVVFLWMDLGRQVHPNKAIEATDALFEQHVAPRAEVARLEAELAKAERDRDLFEVALEKARDNVTIAREQAEEAQL